MQLILGINDENLSYLELLLRTELIVRGNRIEGQGEEFLPYFKRLETLAKEREEVFSEGELYMEYKALFSSGLSEKTEKTCLIVNSRQIYPKSHAQQRYMKSLEEDQVTFAIGPAGTGKTFLAVAYALSELLSGKRQKLVLTRPVVEAGESLGFLPGDLSQKLNPYLKPLYDAMEYLLSPWQIKRLEENGSIEIAPLAYMRGRSVNRSVVILDEAQNTSSNQMKMFLTRLGEDSKAIVTGDPSQVDLKKNEVSGLSEAVSILHDIDSLSVIEFGKNDIIRSKLVRAIIERYDEKEQGL